MLALVYAENHLHDIPLRAIADPSLEEDLQPGCQILFSPSGSRKSLIGYIFSLENTDSEENTVHGRITDILNGGIPVLSPVTLKLAMWISDYYMARPIEAIHAMLPAPLKTTVQDTVELSSFRLQAGQPKITTTRLRKKILEELAKDPGMTVRRLEKKLGTKDLYRTLGIMEEAGLLTIRKKFPSSAPRTATAYRLNAQMADTAEELCSRAPKQLETLRQLREAPEGHLLAAAHGVNRSVLKTLEEKGLAERITIELHPSFDRSFDVPGRPVKALTQRQQEVLSEITSAFQTGGFHAYLLHGVTGSGKTIVYIELLKKVLAAGKNAIVLVPEISLTPQTAARFRHHFGDTVQILHSAMSKREKYEAWQRLRRGQARIALGARSTVFAPLENIGAIIVDEEHDQAYKQDRTPRYHGRDTAVMRAKLEQAICILGSATPAFESYHNALNGKYRLLELPERVDNANMPVIKVVPLQENRRITASLTEILYLEIKKRLERNEQVILLQNRRGFAGSVVCEECGHIPLCPHCNVPMVYHAAAHQLRCHYCGNAGMFHERCDRCGSDHLMYKSSGTERIAEELRQLFPDERILRMDVDTTSVKGAHAMILKEFHDKQARILLGTQMVAKGLDFPDVSLVGVLLADIGLHMPDFRASERLFALLMQVAGRAGRASIPGEVFIQAYNTDHPLFRLLLEGSYRTFYHHEMTSRTELRYPPLSRMIAIEFSSEDEHAAETAAEEFIDHMATAAASGNFTMLGPAPAGMARLKGRYRYQVLIKQSSGRIRPDVLKNLQYEMMGRWQKNGLSVTIDVDPQHLM